MKKTQGELEQWGKWARAGGADCAGYKSQMLTLLVQNVPQPGRREPILITDERAVEIDRALARLLTRDREMGLAVMVYYLSGLGFRPAAALLARTHNIRISGDVLRILVTSGAAWLDAVLNGDVRTAA